VIKEKSIITLTPGVSPVIFLTAVIYSCSLEARLFVPGKPLQPNLMFAGTAMSWL